MGAQDSAGQAARQPQAGREAPPGREGGGLTAPPYRRKTMKTFLLVIFLWNGSTGEVVNVSKSFNDLDTCKQVSLMVQDRYQDEFTFINVSCKEVIK